MMSESNKQQAVNKLTEIVANFTAMISTRMPDDVVDKLKQLKDAETSSMGKIIYHTMFDNMQKAIDLNRPACQEKKSVKVSGHLSSNSGEIVLQWALEGKGIMLRSEWDVLPFLESGKLVQVLPEYAQSANIWAVYREPLYRSMKLRVCVEFLAAWCQQRLGKPDEGYQVM